MNLRLGKEDCEDPQTAGVPRALSYSTLRLLMQSHGLTVYQIVQASAFYICSIAGPDEPCVSLRVTKLVVCVCW